MCQLSTGGGKVAIEWISLKKQRPPVAGVYAVAYREKRSIFWCKALYDVWGDWHSISEPLGVITHWANVELPK